ncbi:A2ML1 protein, partial [Eulacestoma nigropectus]|nr:A2ML1 protein [Eulacestoma nigropectus]
VAPPADGTEEIATVKLTITGDGVNVEEQKKVLICKSRNGTIIQTDKPVYEPGQTVRFRIVTLDEEFLALNDSRDAGTIFSFLWAQDPKNNQIEQWQNVVPQDGIADLSFQLSDEPLLGMYVINVTRARAYGSFSVKERVLPKFEVFFEAPNQIYALDTAFPLRVCGRYTRGKSVQGMVHVSLCQKIAPFLPSDSKPDLCHKFSNQTDEAGCFFTNVSLSSFSRDFRYYQDSIVAEASLVEDATGVQINTSSQILISRTAARAVFETPNEYYIPGVPYRGKIKVQDHYGTGMKNRKVYLVIRVMRRRFIKTYITDDSGIASFNLDTTAWNSSSVSLEGRFTLEELMRTARRTDFSYTNAYHHLQPFHVTTKSFLDIHPPMETLPCGLKQNVQVTFTLSRDDLGEDTSRISFAYYVTGKSGIVVRGQRNIQIGKLNMLKGSFSIPLTFTADLSPSPSLVVYAIFPNGGVTADSIHFDVALCFQNQVKVGFPDKEAHAGSAVQLQLQAASGSLCAVQAVDENIFFTRADRELTSRMVYGLFPAAYQRGYPAQVEEHSDRCLQPQSSSSLLRGRPQNSFQPDIFNLFQNMGLKVFSNLVIKKPSQCSRQMDRKPVMGVPSTEDQRITEEKPQFTNHRRFHHYFPETWIWNLYSVGSSGSRNVSVTAPAAAAEWKVKMFCLARRGFGLAPTMSLRTVQPFFVDVTLPYSVIRGETFLMKATVFSYLQQCIQIHVALAKSSDFQV